MFVFARRSIRGCGRVLQGDWKRSSWTVSSSSRGSYWYGQLYTWWSEKVDLFAFRFCYIQVRGLLTHRPTNRPNEKRTDWLNGWLTDGRTDERILGTDWRFNWLTLWLADCSMWLPNMSDCLSLTDRQTDRQTNRQAERQTDKQSDWLTVDLSKKKNPSNLPYIINITK